MPTDSYTTDHVPREPERSLIIEGLLDLRRSGVLQGVWIDADVIRVRRAIWDSPRRLPWDRAGVLVRAFENQQRVGGEFPGPIIDLPVAILDLL